MVHLYGCKIDLLIGIQFLRHCTDLGFINVRKILCTAVFKVYCIFVINALPVRHNPVLQNPPKRLVSHHSEN